MKNTRAKNLHTSHAFTILCVVLPLICGRVVFAQSQSAVSSLTDTQIQKAIDALVAELYERKNPNRFWEPEKPLPGDSTRQRGGYTALTVLALLTSGQTYQDPKLRDAIDYLSTFSMEGTYAVSLRTGVWARLPQKFRDKLTADAQWLLDGFSENVGGWDYDSNPRTNRKDNSIRQFGALGLWEAAKRGLKIERRYWQKLEDAYLDLQTPSGGWNYTGEGPPTGSMTAAGLATLFITQDFLHATDQMRLGAESASRHQKGIDAGLKWMEENFSPTENPGRNVHYYYYLYGVERVGLASGYRYFGKHDWYREGAAELIRRLLTWNESKNAYVVNATTAGDGRAAKIRTDDLAFALMFFSRGRVPLAMNKLEVASYSWNNRPRDVANLTRWIAENSESDLNWQIVDFATDPSEWLDAPVLYFASHEALPWLKDVKLDVQSFVAQSREFMRRRAAGQSESDAKSPERLEISQLEKLKRYLDSGGLLLVVNEGAGHQFADSIEKAGVMMYPQYEWRNIPDDHWAYTIHTPVKNHKPALRGLSNGVRDLILVVPANDVSETFQKNDSKQAGEFHVATNIYFAASEMNRPHPRLADRATASTSLPSPTTQPQPSLTIVHALHEDNWNPEPQALLSFSRWMATRGVDIRIIDSPLVAIHQIKPPPALVVVNGITEHKFSDGERNALRQYLEGGGVAFFETPGGLGNFTASAEQMATELFHKPLTSLLRHKIITGEGLPMAVNAAKAEYRPFAFQNFGTREITPRLRGMIAKDGGEVQLLFSREDLSHALLDQPCWGVSGYTTQSARELLCNIAQFAMAQKK